MEAKKNMNMKGIARRWLFNSVGVIVLILITLIVVLSFVIQSSIYSGIQASLSGRSGELTNVFADYGRRSPREFSAVARNYVENFPEKESMELMVFSSSGRILITSIGFAPDETQPMPDYQAALADPEGYGTWTGKLTSGEKVMAVTRVIRNNSGGLVGAIRYVVSLEEADKRVLAVVGMLMGAGVLVILFVLTSSYFFLKSILNPIRQIGATARRIAQGDFEARIEKSNDDEIGQLCDTINDMAVELGTAEKMKNDFISSVSHELRTPLTAIKGWAETLSMPGCDEEMIQKGMSVISGETQRLSQMVEELLDFSRMQSGRMKLMKGRMDLIAEISDVVLMQTERARREGKTLLYTEPEQVITLTGDKNRLRQVFVNIIDNALKYSDAGDTVTVTVEMENRHQVLVKVADTGCGIEAKDLDKVKTKFYKANTTRRGSGIGLAVADEIVRAHDGTLELQSVWGEGTTVLIRLPVERADGTQHPGME